MLPELKVNISRFSRAKQVCGEYRFSPTSSGRLSLWSQTDPFQNHLNCVTKRKKRIIKNRQNSLTSCRLPLVSPSFSCLLPWEVSVCGCARCLWRGIQPFGRACKQCNRQRTIPSDVIPENIQPMFERTAMGLY